MPSALHTIGSRCPRLLDPNQMKPFSTVARIFSSGAKALDAAPARLDLDQGRRVPVTTS